MRGVAAAIATLGPIGHLRPGPGTWGSLATLPICWGLWQIGGLWLCLLFMPITFAAGLWATGVMTRGSADHDPSEIIIDEVLGQLIALLPVLLGAAHTGAPILALWPGWIAAFVLFRLFDIWKPSLVGRADRRGDAMGVMLDDVIAGVFAAIGVAVLAALSHGVLMG